MRDNFALDTNIIYYALDGRSNKHRRAKNILFEARKKNSAIPLRSLCECYSLALKKKEEAREARIFIESLKHDRNIEIISATEKILKNALEAENNFWDRMIEETALDHDYNVIYTENTSDFEIIEAFNPFKN